MSVVGRKQAEGFLLLEMLVALAVVAVMGALMSSFLGQLGSINRLEGKIAAQTEADAATAYLQRLLEGARPVRLLDAEANTNPVFDGDNSSIRFAAVTRRGFYSLGLRDIHVFVSNADGAPSLHHTMGARRLSGGKPVPHSLGVAILEKVESVDFKYSDGKSWNGTWAKDGQLPKVVGIRITVPVGKEFAVSEAFARIF